MRRARNKRQFGATGVWDVRNEISRDDDRASSYVSGYVFFFVAGDKRRRSPLYTVFDVYYSCPKNTTRNVTAVSFERTVFPSAVPSFPSWLQIRQRATDVVHRYDFNTSNSGDRGRDTRAVSDIIYFARRRRLFVDRTPRYNEYARYPSMVVRRFHSLRSRVTNLDARAFKRNGAAARYQIRFSI